MTVSEQRNASQSRFSNATFENTPGPDDPKTQRKVRRLFEMMEWLRVKERGTLEMAEMFGVPQRTIQRDLEDLRAMNVGLEELPGHRYRIAGKIATFRPVEALAVHAATRLLYHHAATKNRDYLLALDKLLLSLPDSIREVVRGSTQDFAPQLRDDRVLETVTSAWVDRKYIAFDYLSPNGQSERRELAVYFVEISRANLAPYAIGFERLKRGEIRTFKLSRMKHVTPLSDAYLIPPDFDPRRYLSDAWGVVGGQTEVLTVTLRFAQEVVYRLLEGGYPNLTVEEIGRSDGSVTVKVRAGMDTSGLPRELMPWVLGWGPRVEVLGPPEVRTHWLNEARAVVERFGSQNES
ncbi:transcriptional regulator (plasmid) [Deinococcus sp. KNUC1210]|uniref:helix-turn-helix transcriptional regulator n=1 Tax=Deinococcus sp. KNUC1210 TaxID=2917691 RepID=UPI001EEFBEB5|nr:WYL domain-containing transcriptional regulator [Deinococcus sp. KNUC1210]ULH14104.1 transcriptional regulator [Deinococcus sp. KNUC1210]